MDYCNVMYLIVTAKAVSIKDLAKINKLTAIESPYEGDTFLNYGTINPEFVRILKYLCQSKVGFILAKKDHLVVYNWKSFTTIEQIGAKLTKSSDLVMYYQVQKEAPTVSTFMAEVLL